MTNTFKSNRPVKYIWHGENGFCRKQKHCSISYNTKAITCTTEESTKGCVLFAIDPSWPRCIIDCATELNALKEWKIWHQLISWICFDLLTQRYWKDTNLKMCIQFFKMYTQSLRTLNNRNCSRCWVQVLSWNFFCQFWRLWSVLLEHFHHL